MEWSERMNAAIAYIEDNLAGEIDFNEAAKLACCSLYHFQRMFFAIIGVTPAEYCHVTKSHLQIFLGRCILKSAARLFHAAL